MVDVDGTRIRVRCSGRGAPTVLLISGFGSGAEGWSIVEPSIAARTRVCSYDRPGTGASDPPASTQTFATQAHQLHELLSAVGERGPYVLVGHSFGGAEAVTFASMFPDSVSGLVLVDATPTTWPAAVSSIEAPSADVSPLILAMREQWSDPLSNCEHLDVVSAFAAVSTITSLGSLPMIVITAIDRELPVGIGQHEVARLTRSWNDGQERWARLSTSSRLIPVVDSGHRIQDDHPGLVVEAILQLVRTIEFRGRPLTFELG